MATDATSFIAELPPWLQIGANAALFVITAVGGLWALKKSHKEESGTKTSETSTTVDAGFDADDLLENGTVKKFVANISTIADNMTLQTEALKNISAAATAMGKTFEEDYDERRVHREVERRLAEERLRRDLRNT